MRHPVVLRLAAVLLPLSIATGLVFLPLGSPNYYRNDSRVDTYRYTFAVQNTSSNILENPAFVAYSPADIPGLQEVETLQSTQPYRLIKDAAGNRVMQFELDWLPPYGTRIITVTATVRRYVHWQAQARILPTGRLSAGPYMQLNDSVVAEAAKGLWRGNAETTATAVLNYLADRVHRVQYIREDRGAAYALRERRGDCTEFMYAFSALMRADGVPTLNFGGFISPSAGVLRSVKYHNWSAYRAKSGWTLVDPEYNIPDLSGQRYLIFRVFAPDAAHPLSNTHRFVSTDPRLKVIFN